MNNIFFFLGLCFCCASCIGDRPSNQPPVAASTNGRALNKNIRGKQAFQKSKPPVSKVPPPEPFTSPSPKTVAQAKKLVRNGYEFYEQGAYVEAEEILKEALALYPFLPRANIILGKVLLIRGSATRDIALLNGARLMFEMARAIDPTLREPAILLQLFVVPK